MEMEIWFSACFGGVGEVGGWGVRLIMRLDGGIYLSTIYPFWSIPAVDHWRCHCHGFVQCLVISLFGFGFGELLLCRFAVVVGTDRGLMWWMDGQGLRGSCQAALIDGN
ncbi:hypothetical protein K456DRAFT_156986 [Colletotrichum gloeosporioides 23]|nr:hypothetical protein K456DRAFT_156986 [Colletotrichum gloeosporioides 23]